MRTSISAGRCRSAGIVIPPYMPEYERVRLDSLERLGLLFTPSEARFDRITAMARRLLNTPIALVSLVGSSCQWFKSAQGLAATETPRSVSFCGHAILSDDTLVVPDTLQDVRFVDNPLVTSDPWIRFYAGHPLNSPDGQKIGTLCVIDRRPRAPTASDLQTLRDLAAMVEAELHVSWLHHGQRELMAERDALELRSMLDSMTRCWNRGAVMDLVDRELNRGRRSATPTGLLMLDIDHFKGINDRYGHPVGDQVIVEVARRIRESLRPYDAVGRYGGEEFMVVLPETGWIPSCSIAERIRSSIESCPIDVGGHSLRVTISVGVQVSGEGEDLSGSSLVEQADRALYRAKNLGRNRVETGDLPAAGPEVAPDLNTACEHSTPELSTAAR